MKAIISSIVITLALAQPCFAEAESNIEIAILKLIPYGLSNGVTQEGTSCTVNLPYGPGVYWVMAGDKEETGQLENGHWASAYIYTSVGKDKYHKITNFVQEENRILVRSEDSSERQYISILPKKVYELIVEKKSDGSKSVKVRSGSSYNFGWSTDYSCIIN